ncbi:MAG: hydroxymethylbilane synthase [Candidatus Eisenbacteria bacterium]|nr:hydroxymethylbilane synthase [Candidatus Eisenbacteria bacterium]
MRPVRSVAIGIGPGKLDSINGERVLKTLERFAPDSRLKLVTISFKQGHRNECKEKPDEVGPNELEKALVERKIDIAVLSTRDVIRDPSAQLQIAAVTKRLTPFDALVCSNNQILDELPLGSRVATGSLRVKAQLLHYRPDLELVWTGVEMEAQMKRMTSGVFDAFVISAADAEGMGWQDKVTEVFTTSVCLPAVGQGSLCIEIRRGEQGILKLVKHMDDPISRAEIKAELCFLDALGGSNWFPAGALGRTNGNELVVEAFLASPDGKHLFKDTETGRLGQEREIGSRLAERILEEGGSSILASLGI